MSLRFPFVSLRVRFMALAVFLTLGSSVLWGTWAWHRERDILFEGVTREGEVLVSTMAIPIINALLYEELGIIKEGGLLDNFVAEIMANRRLHPRYAMVLDTEGKVLAHNRFSEYGMTFDDGLTRKALASDAFTQTPILFENERVCDFATPLAIAGKRWGSLRIGVSLEPLYAELDNLTRQIGLFAGLFSAGALVIYWVIGTLLARPISTLTQRMEQVGKNDFKPPFSEYRRDEIGLLQQSFADMIERLRKSDEDRKASLARMVENERLTTAGKIVSGVAHEVNNPLAGIQGAIYQIDEKGGQQVRRYTRLIDDAVDRIRRIVSQLLDLSRVGSLMAEKVRSQELFEELTLFAKMALKDHGCRLKATDLCSPQDLHVDKDKVHQVILNLVLNGADAAGREGVIELNACAEGPWYCLEVIDDGPGISLENREKVFDLFFSTKESGRGSGVGLALCRSIAENHRGTIELCSREDKRTSFMLKIPRKEAL